MKKHLTIILLFVSVCFYGQEIVREIETEGFFRYDNRKWYLPHKKDYHEDDLFYLYQFSDGKVVQPVSIYITDSLEKKAKDIPNLSYVRLKGYIDDKDSVADNKILANSWRSVNFKVTEIVEINSDLRLTDYLKEQLAKQPAFLPDTPFEAKGYFENDYWDGILFFPVEGNDMYAFNKAVITKDAIYPDGFLDSLNTQNSNLNLPLAKVKGFKNPGPFGLSENITITSVSYLNAPTYWKFTPDNYYENVTYFEAEGFYSKGFEMNDFLVLEGDSLYDYEGSVHFTNALKHSHKYKVITTQSAKRVPDKNRGVFVKFKGIAESGGRGYGHMGGSDYDFYVTDIEYMDLTRTQWDFIINKLNRGEYYVRGEKLIHESLLNEGQEYVFRGEEDKDNNHYVIELSIIRNGIYADYTYTVFKNGKKKESHSGHSILDIGWLGLNMGFNDKYVANDKKRLRYDASLFNITVNKDEETGKITAEINDYRKYSYRKQHLGFNWKLQLKN